MKGKEVDLIKVNNQNKLLKKRLEDKDFSNRYTKISKMYKDIKGM